MTTYFSTKINNLTPRRPIDPFTGFGLPSEKRNEICAGMSPEEIAEIVSDRIMEVIQKQFKETEGRFKAEKKGWIQIGEMLNFSLILLSEKNLMNRHNVWYTQIKYH